MSAATDPLSSFFPKCVRKGDKYMGMKTVLGAFGLQAQAEAFAKALYETGAFISGSSALYWCLNDIAETPIPLPKDSDMDIWLPAHRDDFGTEKGIVDHRFVKVSLAYFEYLLAPLGYKRQSAEERSVEIRNRWLLEKKGKPSDELRYHMSPSLRFIKGIHNFINSDLNRKIQFIVTEQRPGIREEILRSFDFDICGLYVYSRVNHSSSDYTFHSVDPTDTERYFGQPIQNTFHLGDVAMFNFTNVIIRLEKYYRRGFVLEVEGRACTACGCECKAKPTKLRLEEAKAYVQAKMKEQVAKEKAGATA